MKKVALFTALMVVVFFFGIQSKSQCQTVITINQMPSAFFGNWYESDGSKWAFQVEKDKFRINNKYWDYVTITKYNNEYIVVVYSGNEGLAYFFKDITDTSISVALGHNRTYTMYTKK